MNNKINFNGRPLYFASDFHFDHNKDFIYKPRGFDSVSNYNEWVLNSLSKIPKDAVLFYLGDFALNSNERNVRNYLHSIPCEIVYILGNHESVTSNLFKFNDVTQFKITGIYDVFELKLKQYGCITLSHFPFAIWNHVGKGAWHLHGHCHGNYSKSLPNNKVGKILDVGVDVAKKNHGEAWFSLDQIAEIMENKKVEILDHHGENTN